MLFEFDDAKDAINLAKHGVSLTEAAHLDWLAAIVRLDSRDYPFGEVRYFGLAPLDGRLHAVWFTVRGEARRIIGLRDANAREIKNYERTRQA